jgi:hypothetical protein
MESQWMYHKEENGNSLQEEKSIQHARNPLSRESIEKLRQFQNQLLQEHGGTPLGSSVELLHEAREEHDRELDFLLRRPVTLTGVEKLMQIRNRMLQEHRGQLFENSIALLRQEREEREKELGQQ